MEKRKRRSALISQKAVGWLLAGVIVLLTMAPVNARGWLSPVIRPRIRRDPAGDGSYNAARNGHLHEGIDLVVEPYEPVRAPFSGYYVRDAYPYANDPAWKGLVISNGTDEVKMFYVEPLGFNPGDAIEANQIIGFAQDITQRYPNQGMIPHIHLEVRQNGTLIDPSTLFQLA